MLGKVQQMRKFDNANAIMIWCNYDDQDDKFENGGKYCMFVYVVYNKIFQRQRFVEIQKTGRDQFWLVVEPTPSEKYESVGMMTFPIYGKLKNDPNHQPDIIHASHF